MSSIPIPPSMPSVTSMLLSTLTNSSDYATDHEACKRPRHIKSSVPKPPRVYDPSYMHRARHSTAVAKYCNAIGTEWVKTSTIASRMGMITTSIFKQLIAYEDKGILVRRPAGGADEYNHHIGWEWKVKPEGKWAMP